MSEKLYARQISPEFQESPLMLGDEFMMEGVIITGNRDYMDYTTDEYDSYMKNIDNVCYEADNMDYNGYKNISEIINEYFPKPNGKKYSTQEIHRWKNIINGEKYPDDDENIIEALTLMTGNVWETTTIRGCCQGDWQGVFYDTSKVDSSDIEILECEYFNTGSEWIVDDDEEFDGENPETISGCTIYCHGWRDEDIKQEIADAFNYDVNNVALYQISGEHRHTSYDYEMI